MKRTVEAILVVVMFSVIIWLITITPPPLPSRSIDFVIGPATFSNGIPQTCSVLVSNVSDYPLAFSWNEKAACFDTAYLSNGNWLHQYNGGVGRGLILLAPHGVRKSLIEVPESATRLKFGLQFTSHTWRGRIVWHFAGSSVLDVMRPIAGFLMLQDDKRFKTEWSDEYPLMPNTNTGNSLLGGP